VKTRDFARSGSLQKFEGSHPELGRQMRVEDTSLDSSLPVIQETRSYVTRLFTAIAVSLGEVGVNQYCAHFKKQAVVLKHNKPRPRVAHRGIARFLGIGQKRNHVVPWSLRTFPENFMQMGPAVFS